MVSEDVVANGTASNGNHEVCGFDSLGELNYFNCLAVITRRNAALSSTIQHAACRKLRGKWRTKRLSTKFSLLNKVYVGYSVKV